MLLPFFAVTNYSLPAKSTPPWNRRGLKNRLSPSNIRTVFVRTTLTDVTPFEHPYPFLAGWRVT